MDIYISKTDKLWTCTSFARILVREVWSETLVVLQDCY